MPLQLTLVPTRLERGEVREYRIDLPSGGFGQIQLTAESAWRLEVFVGYPYCKEDRGLFAAPIDAFRLLEAEECERLVTTALNATGTAGARFNSTRAGEPVRLAASHKP